MVITPLKWDTDFFQMRIAKAEIKALEDVMSLKEQENELKSSFDLIYLFADSQLPVRLDGAKLVDKKVIYSLPYPANGYLSTEIKLVSSHEATHKITSLALISGAYSRFRLDNKFPPGSFERLYSHWILQSLNKVIASEVFCYMIDGLPCGLITLDRSVANNTIGLVAVDPNFQHRGIGTSMIQHVIGFVEKLNNNPIDVATQQDNKPACNLYSKCGFSISSTKDIWHWWL